MSEPPSSAAMDNDPHLPARILGYMAAGVLLVDPREQRVLYANGEAETLFGYAAGGMAGIPLERLDDPAAPHHLRLSAAPGAALGQQAAWRGEVRAVHREGNPLCCSVSARVVQDPRYGTLWVWVVRDIGPLHIRHGARRDIEWCDPGATAGEGTVAGLLAVGQDVTERLRADAALRESETRYRQLVERLHAGLVVHGRDTRILYANPAACTLLGTAPETLLGRAVHDPAWDFRREDGSPLPPEEHPVRRVLDGGRDVAGQVVGVVHPHSGDMMWGLVDAHAQRDADGAVHRVTVTFIDITRQKRIETDLEGHRRLLEELVARRSAEATRESARNDIIVDTAMDGFFLVDPAGRIVDCNRAFCHMLGYEREELLTLSIPDIEATETPAETRAHMDELLVAGHGRFDTRHRRRDGTELDVEVNVTLAEIDGERLFFAFAHDIGERKRAEAALRQARDEAERANQAKSEFLSRMSHELRTPLNAVLGFAQLLESDTADPLSPNQADSVAEILEAGGHLLEMVNEVLDLSRIESGRLELHLEVVPVAPLVEACVAQIMPLARQRDIRVDLDLGPGGTAMADPTRLKQVVLNLLSNAVKYNREGGHIGIRLGAGPDAPLRLAVTDTGPGIDGASLARLFQPFERLGSAYSGIEGTGIGLTLCKRLVEAMGGRIGVDSAPGAGSTFWFHLPRASARPVPAPGKGAGEDPRAHRRYQVLYIEDDAVNLGLLKLLAVPAGLDLATAGDAERGLVMARQECPEVILLDINLPGMGGREAVGRLKADPATRHIPVIAVSGEAREEGDIAAGFDAWLMKPFEVERLRALIRRVVRDAAGQS